MPGHAAKFGRLLPRPICLLPLCNKGGAIAIVVGHPWGNLVELALRHPTLVGGLVLVGGYYFPTLRLDVPFLAVPAIP